MKELTQNIVINEMMGKKLSANTLQKIIAAKYPGVNSEIKTIRNRIDALRNSKHVDMTIHRNGRLCTYTLNSVEDAFYRGCTVQAKRNESSRPLKDARPPFDQREYSIAMRLRRFDHWLGYARS